jgi:hypothetical protein
VYGAWCMYVYGAYTIYILGLTVTSVIDAVMRGIGVDPC